VVVVVDADAHFDGDRDAGRPCRFHGGGDDLAEELALVGQCGTAALAGDARHRAAEIAGLPTRRPR
jgi:hypothetical protein